MYLLPNFTSYMIYAAKTQTQHKNDLNYWYFKNNNLCVVKNPTQCVYMYVLPIFYIPCQCKNKTKSLPIINTECINVHPMKMLVIYDHTMMYLLPSFSIL
jgi:hypothetical protein